MEIFTRESFTGYIIAHFGEYAAQNLTVINKWLTRGDGAAVYVNEDLGHSDLGRVQVVSYGSAAAQLEVADPPVTLPDIGGRINWRYQLHGVYLGDPVTIPEDAFTDAQDECDDEWDDDDLPEWDDDEEYDPSLYHTSDPYDKEYDVP